MNPWTDADSTDLDRQIRALRADPRFPAPEVSKRRRPTGTRRINRNQKRSVPRRRNGRWLGARRVDGVGHREWFDTKQEAQAFLDQLQ